ncbi:MAG: hypothetical protein ACI4LT_08155 [Treponema sp.]
MIVNDLKKKKKVIKSLDEKQKKDVQDYLKNLVEKWCQNTPEKSFKCSELLKANNANWDTEPLSFFHKYFSEKGYTKLKEKRSASIDIGWILKETILEMPQKFKAKQIFRKIYTYIPE